MTKKRLNGFTAEQVTEAIRGTKGIMTAVAKRLGITRSYAYQLVNKWKSTKQALHDERESMKDFTESKLFQNIQSGDNTAIIFYLKTQGKDRGYIERQEYTGADGNAQRISITFDWQDQDIMNMSND